MIRSFFLLLILLAGMPARAEQRPVAVQLGVGSHYGLLGVGAAWRFHERFAGIGGFGAWGPAAGLRAYAWKPLYVQLGLSPQANSEDVGIRSAIIGPDLSAGVDLRRSRFSFTLGLGVGILHPAFADRPQPVFDLGLGVNLGPLKESR